MIFVSIMYVDIDDNGNDNGNDDTEKDDDDEDIDDDVDRDNDHGILKMRKNIYFKSTQL